MLVNQYQRFNKPFIAAIVSLLLISCQAPVAATGTQTPIADSGGKTQFRHHEPAVDMTPQRALALLQFGNRRFVGGELRSREHTNEVAATAGKQDPFASIVSCIDSRIPPELIFDQKIGDLFVSRVAGNFVNNDILGGLEFGSVQYHAKVIVILGHSGCGAVNGACQDVRQGFLTDTLANILPAVQTVREFNPDMPSDDPVFVHKVAVKNVKLNMEKLLDRDTLLRDLTAKGTIKLMGAMYNVGNGQVEFKYKVVNGKVVAL
ncbi:MAG: carbonic anhydrase [Algicola sp.]|nr:carbonic anhydrase [Algicola sp.]